MSGVEIALVVAATAMSMAAAKSAADFQKAAAERQRIEAEEQADLVRIEAFQAEANRLEALNATLNTQRAQGAALGMDPTVSRSFFAIVDKTRKGAAEDIDNIRLASLTGQRHFLAMAEAADIAGRAAQTAGLYKMGGSFLKGASAVYGIGDEAGWEWGKSTKFEPYGE